MLSKELLKEMEKEELIELVRLLDKKIYYMYKYKVFDDVYRRTKDRAAEKLKGSYLDARIKVCEDISELLNKNRTNKKNS